MYNKKQWFTLVELIVVITILAILWTIAFISMQSYSEQARDSTRLTDLWTIKTWLELFQLNAWKYPETSSGFIVTYSWVTVWIQGILWESTITNIDKLNKIPTDPLTEKKYTYSITKTRQEYQLAWLMEADEIGFEGEIISNVNAWEEKISALVRWNYNGVILKTLSWSKCEVLSLPSIVSSLDENTTKLVEILDVNWLVYNGQNNLPTSYRWSKFKADWWFDFKSKKLIVYSDGESCNGLSNNDNSVWRIELIRNLQEAYSGTIIWWDSNIERYIYVDTTNLG